MAIYREGKVNGKSRIRGGKEVYISGPVDLPITIEVKLVWEVEYICCLKKVTSFEFPH